MLLIISLVCKEPRCQPFVSFILRPVQVFTTDYDKITFASGFSNQSEARVTRTLVAANRVRACLVARSNLVRAFVDI